MLQLEEVHASLDYADLRASSHPSSSESTSTVGFPRSSSCTDVSDLCRPVTVGRVGEFAREEWRELPRELGLELGREVDEFECSEFTLDNLGRFVSDLVAFLSGR